MKVLATKQAGSARTDDEGTGDEASGERPARAHES